MKRYGIEATREALKNGAFIDDYITKIGNYSDLTEEEAQGFIKEGGAKI